MLTFHYIYESITSNFLASPFLFAALGAITCYMRVKEYNPSAFSPFKMVIHFHIAWHLIFWFFDIPLAIPRWFMTIEEFLVIGALIISLLFNGLFKGLWRFVLSIFSFIFLCWLTELFFISFWLALVIAITLYILIYKVLL